MTYTLHLYNVSYDGGKTFSTQWLTQNEVEEHKKDGYIVKQTNATSVKKIYY